MLILGVDPAYRTLGYCLVKVNGTPEVVSHGLVDLGSSKAWRTLIPQAIAVLKPYTADVVVVEEITWQGRRKGALALAHLSGAIIGWAASIEARVAVYLPRDVKAATVQGKFPANFSEHEKDAMSLCRLYLNETSDHLNENPKLADEPKTPKRTPRRRTKTRG